MVLLAVHHQRVAGVVAGVEADHDVGAGGEEIDDLPLPSSPHCVPMMTVAGIRLGVCWSNHGERRRTSRGARAASAATTDEACLKARRRREERARARAPGSFAAAAMITPTAS